MVSTAAFSTAREERRRGMAQMMFGEQQFAGVEIRVELPEFLAQQAFLEQLFLEARQHRHLEGAEAARRQRDIGFQQPLDFKNGLS